MNTVNTLKPKQKRSVETKRKIKLAARELFSELGYYSVTSNTIASSAKVPIGSFYNYFGDKKAILIELIRDFNSEFHEDAIHKNSLIFKEITNSRDILQHLELIIERTLLQTNLADPFYRIIHALQFTEPDVLKISEEVRDMEMTFLTEFLERMAKYKPISNIPLTAKLIHSTIENIGLYIHHLGTSFEQEHLIKETAKMFFSYLFQNSNQA